MKVEQIRLPDGSVFAPATQDEAVELCAQGGRWTGQFTEVPDPAPAEPVKKPTKKEGDAQGEGEGDSTDNSAKDDGKKPATKKAKKEGE